MKRFLAFIVTGGMFLLTDSASGQNFAPPAAKSPDAATLKLIEQKTESFKTKLQELLPKIDAYHRADLEIYWKAADYIVRHKEYYFADSAKPILAVLDQGMKRLDQGAAGSPTWLQPNGKTIVRGYRSKVDGSVQPYAAILPAGYGKDDKKWRLDITLHGRDSTLTEVKFINGHSGNKDTPKDHNYVQIDIYGRGNNAYRWAGESDVFEAVNHFIETEKKLGRNLIDDKRIVLRGFSMGGAGSWHLGLHHPDRFCVIGPGAGFTSTHGYIKGLPKPLPDYQEPSLHIYDAVDYAENAANVPIVAYSGEIDPQRQAATNIEERLKTLKISGMQHLIGPGLEHKFPPEWQKKAEEQFAYFAARGRAAYPSKVRFVTYTLKYPKCDWVMLLGLEHHYQQARIEAEWDGKSYTVTAENIRSFQIQLPPGQTTFPKTISINGKPVEARFPQSTQIGMFSKVDGKWEAGKPALPIEKSPLLCGPIDDAFTKPFLCVVGTGKPWHESVHTASLAQLERFRSEWDKYMRGVLVVKKDSEVTQTEMASHNLILFGDPGSNSLMAKLVSKVDTLNWTEKTLEFAGKKFNSATDLPMLIYPQPMEKNYMVFNSGHTFHAAEFQGTNAQLYPRLGDFAVVKPIPTAKDPAAFQTLAAGYFDELWKAPNVVSSEK